MRFRSVGSPVRLTYLIHQSPRRPSSRSAKQHLNIPKSPSSPSLTRQNRTRRSGCPKSAVLAIRIRFKSSPTKSATCTPNGDSAHRVSGTCLVHGRCRMFSSSLVKRESPTGPRRAATGGRLPECGLLMGRVRSLGVVQPRLPLRFPMLKRPLKR